MNIFRSLGSISRKLLIQKLKATKPMTIVNPLCMIRNLSRILKNQMLLKLKVNNLMNLPLKVRKMKMMIMISQSSM